MYAFPYRQDPEWFGCDVRGTQWASEGPGFAHSMVKLADPSNDQLEVSSCSLRLSVKHSGWYDSPQMSNTVLI